MPSQVVQLPPDTLDSILSHRWLFMGLAFGTRYLDAKEVPSGDGGRSLRVHFDPVIYCPEARPPFLDDAYGLLLTSAQPSARPAAPALLPAGLVTHLLDVCGAALWELPHMTGHDRMAITASLEAARRSAPAPRPLRRRSPNNDYETKLMAEARRLQETVAPALARLDRKLASYQANLRATGLEAAIVRLGFQSDLGSRLRLDPGGLKHRPRLSMNSRRGTIADLLRSTHNQLAALQSMAEIIHDAAVEDVSWLRVEMLTDLHRTLLAGVPGQEHAGRLRTGEMRIKSPFDGHISVLALPGDEVAQSITEFTAGFDAALWRDIHPIVHTSLAHAELLRLHSYSDANGRLARLVMQGLLMESGVPGLPLEAMLSWNRVAYIDTITRAVRQGDLLAFVQFLLKTVDAAIPAARRMARLLAPRVERIRDAFIALRADPRFAGTAAELASSMLLGPDPQFVKRTIHGVELACFLSDSGCFQDVDATSLGFTVSGYDTDTAYSSAAARALLAGPMALL